MRPGRSFSLTPPPLAPRASRRSYYGTSLPFGEHAYDNVSTLAYLSSEQALMDHVSLVESLKVNLSATTSPVVLFGGSYGGMLAAWAMLKHPGHFAGAIAASAPITQFMGQVDPRLYTQTIADDFKAANPASFDQIAASWGIMAGLAGTQAGRDHLQAALRVCDKLTSPDWVTNVVFNWVASALGYMAMADECAVGVLVAGGGWRVSTANPQPVCAPRPRFSRCACQTPASVRVHTTPTPPTSLGRCPRTPSPWRPTTST